MHRAPAVLTPPSTNDADLASVPRTKQPVPPELFGPKRSEAQIVEDEYFDDVVAHMAHMEAHTRCDPAMIDSQPELEWHMRPYLLDFLVESHLGLELAPETLFLAVNVIDRYASKRVIYKRHYQLVGCAALWIASKYTDKKTRIPTLAELKMLCCGAYEEHMFVQMELHILATLEWTVGHPTADLFVDLHLRALGAGAHTPALRSLALYMCELSLFHKSLLGFPVSTIAACAVELAAVIATTVAPHAGIPDVSPVPGRDASCLELLAEALRWSSASLQRKYSSSNHCEAFQLAQAFVAEMEAAAAEDPATVACYGEPEHMDECPHTPAPISTTHANYGYITPPFSDVEA